MVGQTVTVNVADASWMVAGEMLWVDQAAGGAGQGGLMQITAKTGNQITLLNISAGTGIPLADATQSGLLKQVSGSSSDYVGGDNQCHALPVVVLGGQLQYVNGNTLQFKPYRGSGIIINGQLYNIPTTGVVGLTVTNCIIDGVGGRNLAVSTMYKVYCFVSSGILTAEFSQTVHVTSTTPGNVGTEIKSGDDTRTLLGLVYINNGPAFADNMGMRWVRSWVNRQPVKFNVGYSGTIGMAASTTYTVAQAFALSYADETILVSHAGAFQHPTLGATSSFQPTVNGTLIGGAFSYAPSGGSAWVSFASIGAIDLGESVLTINANAYTYSAASMVFNFQLSGTVG
jgi:hypothetical protein